MITEIVLIAYLIGVIITSIWYFFKYSDFSCFDYSILIRIGISFMVGIMFPIYIPIYYILAKQGGKDIREQAKEEGYKKGVMDEIERMKKLKEELIKGYKKVSDEEELEFIKNKFKEYGIGEKENE